MWDQNVMARLIGLVVCGALLAGCASLEPEPCTPEWVDYKTDRILDPFVREHRGEIKTLRDLSGQMEDPGMMATLRLVSKAGAIGEMVRDFSDTMVPEIRAAVAQCSEPRQASELLVTMLEKQGVGGDVIAWVETLGGFLEMNSAEIEIGLGAIPG